LFLSNFATITLLDTLRRVPGVGDASLFGALDYSMRIWLNLERMASLDITPSEVVQAVQAQNVQAAVGLVGAAPLLDDVSFQLNITTQGRMVTVEEFENIVVRAKSDGALVKVKDIARVELGAKTSDQVGRYNGKAAAGIQIYQLPGANALATAQGVRDAIKALEPRFPEDVAYNVMYDTTVFVKAT
ncbi:hydrophobe/amphiphile efflux-1 family RND transporter, partial [cyanobacterium TDX16]